MQTACVLFALGKLGNTAEVCVGVEEILNPHSQQRWQPEMIIVNNTQEDCAPLLRFMIKLHDFHFFHP